MFLTFSHGIGSITGEGAAAATITATTQPMLGPLSFGDSPLDAFTSGVYTSTAGTITSETPIVVVGGLPHLGALDYGDAGSVSERVEDSAGNSRQFIAGVFNVPFIAPTVGNPVSDQSFSENTGVQSIDVSGVFTGGPNPAVSLQSGPAGVSLSGGTLSIDTSATGVISAQSVILEATNGGGSITDTFLLDITQVTVPVISGAAISDIADTTAEYTSQSDRAGTTHRLVSANALESRAAILAVAGVAIAANTPLALSVTGLTAETQYYVHEIVVDSGGNESLTSTTAFATIAPAITVEAMTAGFEQLLEADSAAFPRTLTATPPAGTTGMTVVLTTSGSPTIPVSVDGVSVSESVIAEQDASEGSGYTTQTVRYYVSGDTFGDVTLGGTYNGPVGVHVYYHVSAAGGQIRSVSSVSARADHDNSGSTGNTPISVDTDFFEGDILLTAFLGSQGRTFSPGYVTDDGMDQQFGSIRTTIGSKSVALGTTAGTETVSTNAENFIAGAEISVVRLMQQSAATISINAPMTPGYVYALNQARTSAVVPISGTASQAGAIEARVVNDDTDAEIVGWSALAANPSGGAYSGSVTVPAASVSLRFQTRYASDPGTIFDQLSSFCVGLRFTMISQSDGLDFLKNRVLGSGVTTPGLAYNSVDASFESNATVGDGAASFINSAISDIGHPVMLIGDGNDASNSDFITDPTQPVMQRLSAAIALHGDVHGLIFWQGEGNTAAYNESEYIADIVRYRSQVATLTGNSSGSLPLILYMTGTEGGQSDLAVNANYSAIRDTQRRINTLITNAHICGGEDSVRNDTFHEGGDAHARVGPRMAHQIGFVFGNQVNDGKLEVISVSAISATQTRVTFGGGIGSDIAVWELDHLGGDGLPEPATTHVDAAVSDDNFTTTVPATGTRTGVNVMTYTHAALAFPATTRVWQNNQGASYTTVIRDNGILEMPSLPYRNFAAS